MYRFSKTIMLAAALILVISVGSAWSLTKVPARVSIIDISGGYSMITGNYGGFRGDSWNKIFGLSGSNPSVTGSDIYSPTFHFGFSYGQLRNNHLFYSVGFRYTKIGLEDSTIVPFSPSPGIIYLEQSGLNLNLYDIDFNFNYYQSNVAVTGWSPYIGLGMRTGFQVLSAEGRDPESGLEYASESELKFALALNVGIDVKLTSAASNRSHFVLSSANSFDFLGSGNRPRYLNLGLALKYYFRP